MTTEPAPMEGVKRMNVVVVRGLEAGVGQNMGVPPRWDLYAMEIDCRRNCYTCGGFRHMACHCRNRGQRGEGWNTEEEELREILNIRII